MNELGKARLSMWGAVAALTVVEILSFVLPSSVELGITYFFVGMPIGSWGVMAALGAHRLKRDATPRVGAP